MPTVTRVSVFLKSKEKFLCLRFGHPKVYAESSFLFLNSFFFIFVARASCFNDDDGGRLLLLLLRITRGGRRRRGKRFF